MNLTDYKGGTVYVRLYRDDFRSGERFEQYAKFMCQPGYGVVEIPIDSERARQLMTGNRIVPGGDGDG